MHMHRPSALGNGLKRLVSAPRGCRGLATVTETDVESARRYCLKQLQTSDYDAHLIRRFMPPPVQDTYAALRALNLELVRLPEMVSNPTIGAMRVKFWHDAIDRTFAGQPPREPICILLHKALRELEQRTGGGGSTSTKSIKFWVSRLIRTRERHMDNRPFATLDSLEDYAENTYSTIMYATLASMPLRSMHVDHLASHIGKACGIVAVLRGVPVLAAPPQPVRSPSGLETPSRSQALLLPLDVMAEEGVKEEEVFRQGPGAPGLQDAIFKVATRANDHLITAREMLKRLKAGQDPGHEFEHQGEGEHHYVDEESDAARDVRRGFGVLLEAVPAAQWLLSLEKANFDPFAVRAGGWRLPWGIWQALSKERI
ncbi:squalene/phytoene synthase [Trichoderma aethiopicum]